MITTPIVELLTVEQMRQRLHPDTLCCKCRWLGTDEYCDLHTQTTRHEKPRRVGRIITTECTGFQAQPGDQAV